MEPQPVARLYRCGVCGLTAPDLEELKAHMIALHVPFETDVSEGGLDTQEGHQVEPQFILSTDREDPKSPVDAGQSDSVVQAAPLPVAVPPNPAPTGHDEENEVDLHFKVKIPNYEMPMFPKHIKPALFFTCSYCDFKDQSFKNVSIHIYGCHPKKLEVKLRSRDHNESSKDVSIVNNSAYLTGQKMKRSRTLLFSKNTNESDKIKRTKRIFSCNLCNTKCDKEVILDIHKRCHTEGSNRLRCCFCGKDAPVAKAWYGLYIHMVNKHPDQVPAPHYCQVCRKGFVKEWDLSKHMACHSSDKPFKCEACGDAFKFKINLDHHGILRHRMGTEEQRLKLIRRIRARPPPSLRDDLPWLFCTQCNYKTKVKSKLLQHTKIHKGIKDIQCEYCDYKTGDSSSLRRHMWRHKDSKPYSCKFCDFGCIQRPQMQAHYKNKHNISASEAKEHIRHVNGPRYYGDIDADTYTTIQSIQISTIDPTVGDSDVVQQGPTIAIQEVSADNPVDLELLTEAAEGLLAASQIELHTT